MLLARDGHEITIFERSPSLSPKGAGLMLQPAGQQVLAQLGLLPQMLARGARIDTLLGHNTKGRRVLHAAYAQLDARLFGLGIHRGSLFGVLQQSVEASGARVLTGVDVACVQQTAESADVACTHGAVHRGFDLVLVCDGARSRVREQLGREFGIVRRCEAYPFAALWCVVEDKGNAYAGNLQQVYDGTSRMLGVLPTGTLHEGGAPTASLFWSVRSDRVSALRGAGIEAWRREACVLAPFAQPLIEQVQSFEQLIFAPYFDVVCDTPVAGRCVLLGDAAHAMSPQLGLGANLALVDASVFAACLREETHSLRNALQRFALARKRATDFYGFASRTLTPIFQSEFDALAPLRDLLWPWLLAAPYVSRQALLSLVGAKTGLFSSDTSVYDMLALGQASRANPEVAQQ